MILSAIIISMQIFKNKITKDFFWSSIFILFIYGIINNPVTHPMSKIDNGEWYIEQIQKPLFFGVAGHNFLALRDSNGNIVSELHGLATNETTGQTKFVTLNTEEKLKVWEFKKPKYNSLENNFASKILAEGNEQNIISIWNKAVDCAAQINKEDIPYPSFGINLKNKTGNSNSVAYTLSLCMGINTGHLGIISPGDKLNLLEK